MTLFSPQVCTIVVVVVVLVVVLVIVAWKRGMFKSLTQKKATAATYTPMDPSPNQDTSVAQEKLEEDKVTREKIYAYEMCPYISYLRYRWVVEKMRK